MGRRIITTENLEEDVKIASHLRPQLLEDYIGPFWMQTASTAV